MLSVVVLTNLYKVVACKHSSNLSLYRTNYLQVNCTHKTHTLELCGFGASMVGKPELQELDDLPDRDVARDFYAKYEPKEVLGK